MAEMDLHTRILKFEKYLSVSLSVCVMARNVLKYMAELSLLLDFYFSSYPHHDKTQKVDYLWINLLAPELFFKF